MCTRYQCTRPRRSPLNEPLGFSRFRVVRAGGCQHGSPTPGAEFEFRWFTNGNPVDGATSRSFVPSDEHFGHSVRVRVIATAPGYSPVLWESSLGGPVRKNNIRLSGADRYATSVAISKSQFNAGVPVAFIASGANFPDALAGAAVAGLAGGPMLLTDPNALPGVVIAELERLQPQRIVILGGTATISPNVETQLDAIRPGAVNRLAGPDRYATSVAISKSQFNPGVPVAFIASGANFPDALAGAPVAGLAGGPMLLTDPNALPDAVAAELERLNPERIVILGGTATISPNVETRLDDIG
jgi:putative cell wall-binding protein